MELLAAVINNKAVKPAEQLEAQVEDSDLTENAGEFAIDYFTARNDYQEVPALLTAQMGTQTYQQEIPSDLNVDALVSATEQAVSEEQTPIPMDPAKTTLLTTLQVVTKDTMTYKGEVPLVENPAAKQALNSNEMKPSKANVIKHIEKMTAETVRQENQAQVSNNKLEANAVFDSMQAAKAVAVHQDLKQLSIAMSNQQSPQHKGKIQLNHSVTPSTAHGIGQHYQQLVDHHPSVQHVSKIAEPLNHPDWQQSFAEKIVWMGQQQLKGALIKLNPPELGPLDVKIQFTQEQTSISFTSVHAPVREAIEDALPRLRDMFESNGLSLDNVNVADRSDRQNKEEEGLTAEMGDEDATHSDSHNNQQEEQNSLTSNISTSLVDRYV